jgi:hypothetical protein
MRHRGVVQGVETPTPTPLKLNIQIDGFMDIVEWTLLPLSQSEHVLGYLKHPVLLLGLHCTEEMARDSHVNS